MSPEEKIDEFDGNKRENDAMKIRPDHDFLSLYWVDNGKGKTTVSAEFVTYPSPKDIMARGGQFYAIWNPEEGLWSTNRSYAYGAIDAYIEKLRAARCGNTYLFARNASSKVCDRFNHYCEKLLDEITEDGAAVSMNSKLVFKSDPPRREDYATRRLKYDMKPGPHDSFDKIINTLYDDDEAHKIIWCVGSIFAGASVNLQKFLVLYGPAGAGKSTILNIVEQLFEGYTSTFDAKSIGSTNNTFSLEAFKDNPLVAIQHDGDLSHIIDNTKLNSLVSHEKMLVNPKYGRQFQQKFNSFLMMGTNSPVKITDQKSGLIRRLIDCKPSGRLLSPDDYDYHMRQIQFELGAIAYYCKETFENNPNAYDHYKPIEMISITNDFYNFVLDNFNELNQDSVSLSYAYNLYKAYNEAGNMDTCSLTKFREELKNYYKSFVNNTFYDFKHEMFTKKKEIEKVVEKKSRLPQWLTLKKTNSIFDFDCKEYPAQLCNEDGNPLKGWDYVTTTLADINTEELHFIRVPMNLIVIDFDVKVDGEKSLQKNLELASSFPKTYAEVSKSGGGLHLHYWYDGDPEELSSMYDDHIEIKVYKGKSALRRKLSLCNEEPIAHISSGLPLKERSDKKVLTQMSIESELHLRNLIEKNLRKEIHASTHSSMCMIKKILDDAYADPKLFYDVSDMQPELVHFALGASNQSEQCLEIIALLHLKKEAPPTAQFEEENPSDETPPVIYDIEVFPNLFVVAWCYDREDYDTYDDIQVMINPSPEDIKRFLNFKIGGFNNISYDNQILYARAQGYSLLELYKLSQAIVHGETKGFYAAKHISFFDIYDFASTKQSLKKWEIKLGIHHLELGLKWDKPVHESLWKKVAHYCKNDVYATRCLFHYKDIRSDWIGRKILAEISGLTYNHSNNDHSKAIIFGNDKNPALVYTDLKTGEQFYDGLPYESTATPGIIKAFPDYEYVKGEDGRMHNMMRGVELSRGGWVTVRCGAWANVGLIDVNSLHPTSMRQLDIFGRYNKKFCDIVDLRLEIKHGNYDRVETMFDGKLKKYLDDKESLKGVKQALKMVINPVYGLTSAQFPNPFKDPRNVNNIVALRGALFMKELYDAVEAEGYIPIHVKTDSIKIADCDEHIVDFCMKFAEKYGYVFDHEATYDRLCIVNKATYIAHSCYGEHCGEWTATAAQFQQPYVFKTLFSKEEITFEDCCEVYSVKKGDIYLDFNEKLPDVSEAEKQRDKLTSLINKESTPELISERSALADTIKAGHDYTFIGRVGQFTPIKAGNNAGELKVIIDTDLVDALEEKPSYVSGSSGYRWMESETVRNLHLEDQVDKDFYRVLVDDAREAIGKYTTNVDAFCDETNEGWYDFVIPWYDETITE